MKFSGTSRVGLTVLFLVLAAMVIGCKEDDFVCFLRAYENDVSCDFYRVDVPDSIIIFAPSAPEIHNHSQTLQPDGKITLELLGEVYVAGLTSQQIADKIQLLISEYYDDVEVRVRVTGYNSKKYYTFGEMGPGAQRYTGRDTLFDVLVQNQPSPTRAQLTDIRVIRPSPDKKKRRVMHVNFHTLMKSGDTTRNILLQPGDIIYAPKNGFAIVSDFIAQFFMPISPARRFLTEPAGWRDDWVDLTEGVGRHQAGGPAEVF
jgi:polysaccharide export outer membrane protein